MNLALSNTIIDRLLGGAPKEWDWNQYYQGVMNAQEQGEKAFERERQAKRQKNTKPSHPLDAYVGTYEEPAYGTADIKLDNGILVWQWSTFKTPLEHFHFDTFTAKNDVMSNPPLIFRLSDQGDIVGFRVLEVDFKKVAKSK